MTRKSGLDPRIGLRGVTGPRNKSGVTTPGKDGRCGCAAIRVPIRPMRRHPAPDKALHPVHKTQTGQQWNKSGHDERGALCV